MAPEWIDDPADPRLDPYRDLEGTHFTRPSGLLLAESRFVVERLLRSGLQVRSVLACPPEAEALAPLVHEGTPLLVAAPATLREITGFKFHRGVLACAQRPAARPWADLFPAAERSFTVVACSAVADPENLGSILRSSLALGAAAVFLDRRCADPYSKRVIRVSMGAVFALPLLFSCDLPGMLRASRERFGVRWVAAVACPGARALEGFTRPKRLGLLLGNEGAGLGSDLLGLAEARVRIPMAEGQDSLNVAVAAGIFLYALQVGASGRLAAAPAPGIGRQGQDCGE